MGRWLNRLLGRDPPESARLPVTGGRLRIEPPDALLATHRSACREIEQLLALPAAQTGRFVHTPLAAFARLVQRLPASESHHHAGAGGMLLHTLDVVINALKLRRGYLLPPGCAPEAAGARRAQWNYAVFTAALLHDAGKPVVDQDIRLFDARGQDLGLWNPWLGCMDAVPGAVSYRLAFRRTRRHKAHERVAALLAPRLLPTEALAWIGADAELLPLWLAAITGETGSAGVIGELLERADGQSTAQALGATLAATVPAASNRVIPLHERMMGALRQLIAENRLPRGFNSKNASGWYDAPAALLWLVSKPAADLLREELLANGHSGVPGDNNRIFDVLQQGGCLLPTEDGRAIWRCTVRGDAWSHELSLIAVLAAAVWPDENTRPAAFAGEIVPRDGTTVPAASTSPIAAPATPAAHPPATADGDMPAVAALAPRSAPTDRPEPARVDTQPHPEHGLAGIDLDPLPLPPGIELLAAADDDGLDAHGMGAPPPLPTPSAVVPAPPSRPAPPVTPGPAIDATQAAALPITGEEGGGRQFITWLRTELEASRLAINTVSARLHRVDEGLLLVSPGLFRDFVRACPDAGTFEQAQRRFQRLGLHRKPADGSNIVTYAVVGDHKRGAQLKGYLLPDAALVLGTREPPVNPHLKRVSAL